MDTIYIESPLGFLAISATDNYLLSLDFVKSVPKLQSKATPILKSAAQQLEEYFAGKRRKFELDFELAGTHFQTSVWQALTAIPYGQVISYRELAQSVGAPKAFRACGNANGKNPLPIIVPCHRVIASGGGLGGYSAGLDKKRWLLAHEGVTLVR